jgi:DNA-binding NarL/FixJ family response regulator
MLPHLGPALRRDGRARRGVAAPSHGAALGKAAPRPQVRQLEPERELEVLRLIARGMSNQEIADTLVVGEETVRSHVSAVLRKLQLASRTQAALYALREGLASLKDADPPE